MTCVRNACRGVTVRRDGCAAGRYDVCAAFTLIELLVVVVLISVVSGLVAPRLLNFSRRDADESARAVRNLLSIAAHRDALASGRTALEYDAGARSLALLMHGAASGERAAGWRADPLVEPVALLSLTLESAALDGGELDPAGWRVTFPAHEPRGVIEIVLADAGAPPRRWRVALLPDAAEATLDDEATRRTPASIDLDAQGRGEVIW